MNEAVALFFYAILSGIFYGICPSLPEKQKCIGFSAGM